MGKAKYGAYWDTDLDIAIEMACIRQGGQWRDKKGRLCGAGLFHHYQAMQKLLWPMKQWHRWNEILLNEFTKGGICGVLGPASSGKTHEAACYALCLYYCFPRGCTILCSSTTREMLDLRIWGEIKKYHRKSKEYYPTLIPGHYLESRQTITTDSWEVEGREFRDGIKGVPCRRGGQWTGLGDYVGVKNKIVVLIADEGQLMPSGFFDAVSNLNTNPKFQLIALGNPKDPTDPLGQVCEPKEGWESIEETGKTRVWNTRIWGGRTIQLVGTDSPNYDYQEGAEPFSFLIGRRAIKQAKEYYGEDSWQYQMMCQGTMPKSIAERRVITRALCYRNHAHEEAIWANDKLTKLLALDVAYSGVGGDRTVAGEWQFGYDPDGKQILTMLGRPMIVSVKGKDKATPEEQIASWTKTYCEERGIAPGHVFFDGTGRSSLTSAFGRLWSAGVVPIEFGGKASDRPNPLDHKRKAKDSFKKFVSELWFAARGAVESGQIRGLTDDAINEGCMRAWDIGDNGTQDVEPKEETKKRLGRSPDIFDMVVCAVEGARRLGFALTKENANVEKDWAWVKDLSSKFKSMLTGKELAYGR